MKFILKIQIKEVEMSHEITVLTDRFSWVNIGDMFIKEIPKLMRELKKKYYNC